MYEFGKRRRHRRDALKTVRRTVFFTGFRIPRGKIKKNKPGKTGLVPFRLGDKTDANNKRVHKAIDKNRAPHANCVSRLSTGALRGIRTPDLLVRSQTLYPTELAAQMRVQAIAFHRPNIIPPNAALVNKFLHIFYGLSKFPPPAPEIAAPAPSRLEKTHPQ